MGIKRRDQLAGALVESPVNWQGSFGAGKLKVAALRLVTSLVERIAWSPIHAATVKKFAMRALADPAHSRSLRLSVRMRA